MKLKLCVALSFWILLGSQLKAQITEIPFVFKGTHLFIKVQTKDNDSLNFIFDTGATGATLDSASAERLGISKGKLDTVAVAGAGSDQSYRMAANQFLRLGRTEFPNLNLILVNFATLSKAVGAKLDGIIGYEVLERYVAKLDFDHRKLLLYDGIGTVDTTGYTGIPFEFSKGIQIPRFPVSIGLANGERVTGKVMFDTGSVFSLIVSPPFAKFHDFEHKVGKTVPVRGRGMDGLVNEQIAQIGSTSFQGFNFGKMSVRLTVNAKAVPKDGYLGIIGIEVIKRFQVILDYAHQRIYLKPNLAYTDKFKQEGK